MVKARQAGGCRVAAATAPPPRGPAVTDTSATVRHVNHEYALTRFFLPFPVPPLPRSRLPQLKRQLHRTGSELFDTCLSHFRASAKAGAAAFRDRLGAIEAAVTAAADGAAASSSSLSSSGRDALVRTSRSIDSKVREEREAREAAVRGTQAAVKEARAAVAAEPARKSSRKEGGAAAREAASGPWYGKYVALEENALTLPEVPKLDEELIDWDDGRRSSSRNVSVCVCVWFFLFFFCFFL